MAKSNTFVPWIRETVYGENVAVRAEAIAAGQTAVFGPSDLFHWGRYLGEKSTQTKNQFAPIGENRRLEQDGYVGYYHFANGFVFGENPENPGQQLEDEAVRVIGDSEITKENVVTVCMYNPFSKLELRARVVVFGGLKKAKTKAKVSSEFTVALLNNKKSHSYSKDTLVQLGRAFFHEIDVANIVRMFVLVDNPAHRLCGTRNEGFSIEKLQIAKTVNQLVELLPKGAATGHSASFGVPSSCGESPYKTTRYRNRLVDTLVRVVGLDSSGQLADYAIERILEFFGSYEFSVVQARLLTAQHLRNNDQRFLQLIHSHLKFDSVSTQSALLLLLQVRFLIAKGLYFLARQMALRLVLMLPLDFDAWYTLTVCYILEKNYDRALATMNQLPVVLSQKTGNLDCVDGILDPFAQTFVDRLLQGHVPIALDVFELFFPNTLPPQKHGKVQALWHDVFLRENARHPICGPFFLLPLATASTMEMAAVDYPIVKVFSPSSPKNILSARLAGVPWCLVLDFDRQSTWGRVYDLLTLLAAVIGWENLVAIKNQVFRASTADIPSQSSNVCVGWLEQLFVVVHDDIQIMVTVSGNPETDHHRLALSWVVLGLLGWSSKYNLKELILLLATGVAGTSADGGFEYFATTKLLEIYNEFVLSDVNSSTIDPLTCPYDSHSFTNKLIVQSFLHKVYRDFVHQLVTGYLTLDTVLLHVMKLASWDLRWYSHVPLYLVTNTLVKLCQQHDKVFLATQLRVVFESHRARVQKPKKRVFGWFGGKKVEEPKEFAEDDSIVEYLVEVLENLDGLERSEKPESSTEES